MGTDYMSILVLLLVSTLAIVGAAFGIDRIWAFTLVTSGASRLSRYSCRDRRDHRSAGDAHRYVTRLQDKQYEPGYGNAGEGGIMIKLIAVHRIYCKKEVEVPALSGVSLSISEGRWLSLIGPSGAGKSTLLNIIGLLDRPTTGRYLLHGRDVTSLPDRESSQIRNMQFGFIFQTFNLLPQYTAWENVALPLYYGGVNKRDRRGRAREMLCLVGLEERVEHLPAELSGGEEQRVAIARALANEPKLILADEPTGNLDQRTGQEVMALLTRLHQGGMGIILVTHDQHLATQGQEIVRIVDGKITGDEPSGNSGV